MTPILLTNRSAPFQAAVLKNEDRWLAEPDVQTIVATSLKETADATWKIHEDLEAGVYPVAPVSRTWKVFP